jgi:hypothetical protein
MAPAGPVRPGVPLAAVPWPPAPSRAGVPPVGAALLLLTLAGPVGCGHATAPCPTPPATLDAHRAQSEALQQDLGQVAAEMEDLESRREEAARRIQAASALEDSLGRTPTRSRKR